MNLFFTTFECLERFYIFLCFFCFMAEAEQDIVKIEEIEERKISEENVEKKEIQTIQNKEDIQEFLDNALSQFVPELREKQIEKEKQEEKFVEVPKKEVFDIVDALRLVAPGTELREALDDIVRARKGALIVIASPTISDLIEGGFKLNCRFTPQRLFELAKMDGAIILSNDLKKIVYSNCVLIPHPLIPSDETGTRHKAAERTAKQSKSLVIAISERRNTITLYYSNLKYSLRSVNEILSRAVEKLNVLDKQKDVYKILLNNLNRLEVASLTTIGDVAMLLQRIEIILRISETIKKNIIELGNEGEFVKMRLKEITKDLEKNQKYILKDYGQKNLDRYYREISNLSFDSLLEINKVAEIAFNGKTEDYVKPKGYRLFSGIGCQEDIEKVMGKFLNMQEIFDCSADRFEMILESRERAEKLFNSLQKLKENIILEKNIIE